MRLTKKQIIKLIKESLNNTQNSDNTIEKIILKECLYRVNYLKEFTGSFNFFIANLSDLVDAYDEEIIIKMQTLDARLASEDFESASMKLSNLSQLREVLINPAKKDINDLYKHVKRLSLQLARIVQFLEALSGKVAKLSSDSFGWCNSGKYDGVDDANEFIIANYSVGNSENIDILQYIIDTWTSQDFIISRVDSDALTVLSQYDVLGINTHDKIDTLLSFMDPGEALGDYSDLMAYMGLSQEAQEVNLMIVNDLITQKTPGFISSYTGNIEEIIFTLKSEKTIEFEKLLQTHKSVDDL